MAVCYEQMLASSLKSGNLLNTYFIFGDDAYLKKMYVDRIIDKTVDRDDVFNFLKFDDSASLQEVYDAKEEFPMMSDKKCVVLCDYDFEHASKSDFDKLIELLSNPIDTTVFIMWCNNLEFDFKRCDKAKKLAAAAEKEWLCLNCGHIHKGPKAPKQCPVCAHAQGYFIERETKI